jgi:transposase
LPAVFGFLFDPSIDATTWRAEQALRPAVVNRKVSGGNRSSRGAATQQILASVVHTARVRHLDTRDVLVDLLRARQPIISQAFTLPRLNQMHHSICRGLHRVCSPVMSSR